MKIKNIVLTGMTILATVASVQSVFASGIAVLQGKNAQDSRIEIEYLDAGTLRMNLPDKQGGDSYMLMLDGKTYMVSNSGGKTMVMDMAQLGSMASGLGMNMGGGDSFKQELVKYNKTGKSEKVAGYKGKIYTLTWRDNKGTHTADAVLSSHKNVREFSEAWMHMAEAMASSMGQKITSEKSIWSFLEREGKGVLRLGDDFRVVSIDSKSIDANRFVLPAAPMQIPSMGKMGGYPSNTPAGSQNQQDSAQQESSLWSSVLGQQAERQQDRGANQAQRTVDHGVDKAMDKAVGGMLKGIFGR